jgi:acetoin utilization deacetylase AcuC-like enzyme
MACTKGWKYSCAVPTVSRTVLAPTDSPLQRAKPATKREMTQFHSDEYVDFLNRITPVNMNSYIKEQHKCAPHTLFPPSSDILMPNGQIMLATIVPYLMGCSNIAQYQRAGLWVRDSTHLADNGK